MAQENNDTFAKMWEGLMKPETDNEDTEISHSETSPATKDTKEQRRQRSLL